MKELHETIVVLRVYILPILLKRQNGVCASCGLVADNYDIDHKIYNAMVTINELQALCITCHNKKTWPRHRIMTNSAKRSARYRAKKLVGRVYTQTAIPVILDYPYTT